VDDAAHARGPQALAQRGRLSAAERAEVKPVEMAVQDVMRIFYIRVPDQEKPRQLR